MGLMSYADRKSHFVTLNCSGQKFLISRHLLDQYPKTLLGNEEKRRTFWDDNDQEYFFDRHYYAFRSIFDFYRTGKLQRPVDIPINVFIREVQFYEIQNEIIPAEYLRLPLSKIRGNSDQTYARNYEGY